MTQLSGDVLSFCTATVLGLAVSTGHPAGIAVAAGMPIVCLIPGTRRSAFENTLGYYTCLLYTSDAADE